MSPILSFNFTALPRKPWNVIPGMSEPSDPRRYGICFLWRNAPFVDILLNTCLSFFHTDRCFLFIYLQIIREKFLFLLLQRK